MPRLDSQLKKTMKYTTWDQVAMVAPHRKPGYIEACKKLSIEKDGMLYFKPKDWNTISKEFRLEGRPVKQTAKLDKEQQQKDRQLYTSLVNDFFAGNVENKTARVQKLYEEYYKELQKMGGASCTSCQLAPLKRKYMALLKEEVIKKIVT